MSTEQERKNDTSTADTAEFTAGELAAATQVLKHYGPAPSKITASFGAVSHTGLVRKNNEDHFAVARRTRSREILLTNVAFEDVDMSLEEAYALSVADGMGGAAYGEMASALVFKTAWDIAPRENFWMLNAGPANLGDMREKIEAFVEMVQREIESVARSRPEMSGMGTTWTLAYVVGRRAYIGHIGDSRAYRVRGGQIERLTRDHTLAEALVATGIPENQVSHVRHVLTNCLNAEGQAVTVDVSESVLVGGDWLLLCTDGLHDLVQDAEIAELVQLSQEPQAACEALLQLALHRGGKDNVTIVAAKFEF